MAKLKHSTKKVMSRIESPILQHHLLPAISQDVLNYSPTAHPFLQALKGYLFFFPVNGSIYSFKLIWSSAISS